MLPLLSLKGPSSKELVCPHLVSRTIPNSMLISFSVLNLLIFTWCIVCLIYNFPNEYPVLKPNMAFILREENYYAKLYEPTRPLCRCLGVVHKFPTFPHTGIRLEEGYFNLLKMSLKELFNYIVCWNQNNRWNIYNYLKSQFHLYSFGCRHFRWLTYGWLFTQTKCKFSFLGRRMIILHFWTTAIAVAGWVT